MEPPFLATELRKTAAMAHLRMLQKKFVRKQIEWTGRAGRLYQNDRKWAWLLKIRAQKYINRTPLLEILDPPLHVYAYARLHLRQNVATPTIILNLRDQKSNHEIHENLELHGVYGISTA